MVGVVPSRPQKEDIVAALRHESLPCPARGLEFVLYTADAVRVPSADAAFALNLNTGARMPLRVDFEPDPAEGHWFPIDRSILAARGVALHGPPAAELFAPIPHRLLLPLLGRSVGKIAHIKWHWRRT